MKKLVLLIIFIFSLGVFLTLIYRYSLTLKENRALKENLTVLKEEKEWLEKEKKILIDELDQKRKLQTKLFKENKLLKSEVKSNRQKLAELGFQLEQLNLTLQKMNQELLSLQIEKENLFQEAEALKKELAQLNQENALLNQKLNSPQELKKILRELKLKNKKRFFWQFKTEPEKIVSFSKPKTKDDSFELGNQGYLLRNGKFMYPLKRKIEVKPAFIYEYNSGYTQE